VLKAFVTTLKLKCLQGIKIIIFLTLSSFSVIIFKKYKNNMLKKNLFILTFY
tara:strand:- start:86415 stop:86570 length:156 start_codon:yes stop_codon:yes gene_type:complete